MSGLEISHGKNLGNRPQVKHIYVIAGDYMQYHEFIHSIPPEIASDNRYHYVSEEYQLRGIMEPEIILCGSYLNLPHWEDLHLQIKLCRGKVIAYE